MCWKEEWASAHNQISHAIAHIEKAQVKLNKRAQRNTASLEKHTRDRYETMKINRRLKRNGEAESTCQLTIDNLRTEQARLRFMIDRYGIKHSENGSKRLSKLMSV